MVDVADEAAAQREAARKINGEFGNLPNSAPELELALPAAPESLAELRQTTDATRARLSAVLIDHIDASMPEDADFVNYEYHPDADHLRIYEACGYEGAWLDLKRFTHIDDALRELGKPYSDYDGDLLLSSLDDFGWERVDDYSAAHEQESAAALQIAREDWHRARDEQHDAAVAALREAMGEGIDALDFSFDVKARKLTVVGVIHAGGRCNKEPPGAGAWAGYDELAEYIGDPDSSPLAYSELSGLYRLTRT
jgi:hypothetical protein